MRRPAAPLLLACALALALVPALAGCGSSGDTASDGGPTTRAPSTTTAKGTIPPPLPPDGPKCKSVEAFQYAYLRTMQADKNDTAARDAARTQIDEASAKYKKNLPDQADRVDTMVAYLTKVLDGPAPTDEEKAASEKAKGEMNTFRNANCKPAPA